MSTRLHIPARVNFGLGYKIKVVQLPHTDFIEECGEGCYACWLVDERTIYLDTSRTIRKRRADYCHELVHAVADFQIGLLSSRHCDVED